MTRLSSGIGIRRSIALCVSFYVVLSAAAFAVYVIGTVTGRFLAGGDALALQLAITWPIVLWLGFRWTNLPLREVFPAAAFPVAILPAFLSACFGATILLLAAGGWIPVPEEIHRRIVEWERGSSRLSVFLTAVVIAPVAEELLFRGVLLQGLLRRHSVPAAVWTSSIAFALFHLNPWQGILALPLGFAFAWITLRTGSLIPAVLGHATANASASFLLVPLAGFLGYETQLDGTEHMPPLLVAIGVVTMIGGVMLLHTQLRRTGIIVSRTRVQDEVHDIRSEG